MSTSIYIPTANEADASTLRVRQSERSFTSLRDYGAFRVVDAPPKEDITTQATRKMVALSPRRGVVGARFIAPVVGVTTCPTKIIVTMGAIMLFYNLIWQGGRDLIMLFK